MPGWGPNVTDVEEWEALDKGVEEGKKIVADGIDASQGQFDYDVVIGCLLSAKVLMEDFLEEKLGMNIMGPCLKKMLSKKWR